MKMEHPENLASKRHELVAMAEAMLAGEADLLEGARRICALRFAVEDPENEVFLALRAIDSETDHFPLGAMRPTSSPEYLKRADGEMQAYLVNAREDILQACREIVKAFS
jgi:hypothetical protein